MFILSVVLVLLFFFGQSSNVLCVWTSAELRPRGYNPLRSPRGNSSIPVDVGVSIEIFSLLAVDEFEQSFTVDMQYRLTWNDYRLTVPSSESEFPVILDFDWKSKLWVPDVYFHNSLSMHVLKGFSPLKFLEVDADKNVSIISRMTVKLACDMNLDNYPHDRQQCFFDSTTLSYAENQINLVWNSFTIDSTIYFPKFEIYEHKTIDHCPGSDRTVVSKDGTIRKHPCIRGVLKLSRKFSFYVIRYYGPSILITASSFVTMWIPYTTYSPRIGGVLQQSLCLIMMHNEINSEVRASYVLAIHVWMFMCLFITFMGLAEFCVILVRENYKIVKLQKLQKKEKDLIARHKKLDLTNSNSNSEPSKDGKENTNQLNVIYPIEQEVEEEKRKDEFDNDKNSESDDDDKDRLIEDSREEKDNIQDEMKEESEKAPNTEKSPSPKLSEKGIAVVIPIEMPSILKNTNTINNSSTNEFEEIELSDKKETRFDLNTIDPKHNNRLSHRRPTPYMNGPKNKLSWDDNDKVIRFSSPKEEDEEEESRNPPKKSFWSFLSNVWNQMSCCGGGGDKKENLDNLSNDPLFSRDMTIDEMLEVIQKEKIKYQPQEPPHPIDQMMRLVYPIMYAVFICLYFTYYINFREEESEGENEQIYAFVD